MDMRVAALQLYDYGLKTIPLKEKRPIIKGWSERFIEKPLLPEEIMNGIQQDGRRVTYVNKNIGILTGAISNVIVVDVDDVNLLEKFTSYGELPTTWTVKTSRGCHLYYRYTNIIKSTRIWDGIDILSDKKIVVAPPSIHPSGIRYKWVISPRDVEIAELPTWLISLLKNIEKTHSKLLYKRKKENDSCYVDLEPSFSTIDWLEYYSRHLGNIKGNSVWLSASCPFHTDQNNSFAFNIQNGGWVCFSGCGKGNGVQFLEKLHNISFFDVLDLLKGRDVYV